MYGTQESVKKAEITNFNSGGCMAYSFRTTRYRFVVWVNNSTMQPDYFELYDYQVDPYEMVNRHDDPAYAAIEAALLSWFEAGYSGRTDDRDDWSTVLSTTLTKLEVDNLLPPGPDNAFDLHEVNVSRTKSRDAVKIHANANGQLTAILKTLSDVSVHTCFDQAVTSGNDYMVPLNSIPASVPEGVYKLVVTLGSTTKYVTVVH
jgi:hypothetical protein